MIHIVVALIHEAKPLIAHYAMKPLAGNHPFGIYRGDAMTLIISGVGKIAAATAVGYLQGLKQEKGSVAWLNLGIAGHQKLDISQGFIAHRIQDHATGRVYYPPQVLPFALPSSNLITVDIVEKNYSNNSGYDMEASGFYSAAMRSTTAEFVQSYKITSDHPEAPVNKMSKTFVAKLIAERMPEIKTLISVLTSGMDQYKKIQASPPLFDEIMQSWHFTETQKIQAKRLLQRAKVLFGDQVPPQIHPNLHKNTRTFLKTLSETLAHHQQYF